MKGREFLSQYNSGPMPSGLRTREVLYIVIWTIPKTVALGVYNFLKGVIE